MPDFPDYLTDGDGDSFDQIVEEAAKRHAAARAGANGARLQQPLDDAEPKSEAVVELPVVSAASFADKLVPPRPWIIPDMIPDRTVTICGRDGGDGKTTLMLQLATAMAGTRPWLGHSPDQAPVLFVSAEDDIDELHRRLDAIAKSLSVALSDLGDLHLVLLAGKDAVMGAPERKTGLVTPTAVWRGLIAHTEKFKPGLVILDALADVFAGEENARAQARQFIGLLRGLAIDHSLAVVLIAHPSLTGMASGSGTSGSTAWSNSVRSRLYLERVKDGDGKEIDADIRVLRVKKANYGPTGLELRLRWKNGAFILDGSASSIDKLTAEAKAERVFLDLLAVLAAQDRDVSPKPGPTYAPSVFAKHPDNGGVSKVDFAYAMERLLKRDEIRVERKGPPSKERQRLVREPPKENAE
jgi:RecA-family ATPase